MGKPIRFEQVSLENNELFQEQDDVKVKVGEVQFPPNSGGIQLDENKNLVTAEGVTIIDGVGNVVMAENVVINDGHNNLATGKNSTIKGASGCTLNATDTDILQGANYAGCSGDAHDISGYSSRTDGYQNQNHIDGGIAQGTNVELGKAEEPNKYSQSGGVGATMSIQGDKIWVYGNAKGKEFTQEGTYLCCNGHVLALKPDGTVWINDVKIF